VGAGRRARTDHAVTVADPMIINLDATLFTAHSERQRTASTSPRGDGFHPLYAFVDHGQGGTDEPLVIKLSPGSAGSNTAAEHIDVMKQALARLPGSAPRCGEESPNPRGRRGETREFLTWPIRRRLTYPIGLALPFHTPQLYKTIPEDRG
jgi:hypothetical protein